MAANAAPVIPAAPSAAVVAGYAAVAVLGSRELWDPLTWFMRGYPLVVSTFLRECTRGRMASAMRRLTRKSHSSKHLRDSLVARGRLPHLAIAANDLHMLKVLLRLGKKPQYARDRQLSFAAAHHCAVAFNHVEILNFICRMRYAGGSEPRRNWEPWLMRLALERGDPDVRVLDQLIQKLPQGEGEGGSQLLLERDLLRHTKRGNLEVVCWLHERGCPIYQVAVDAAAEAREVAILRYFYEHSDKRCQPQTATNAARTGALETVKLIVENTTRRSMYSCCAIAAAEHGQLEVVKYFVESDHLEFQKLKLINRAAWGGYLPVVKYLHEKYSDGSIGAATDNWVEEAINRAATGGQVEVVKFLCLNTAQGCHRPSLVSALRYGAGRFETVEFLWEREDFDCEAVLAALIGAVPYGDLRTLALLHRKLRAEGESAYPALQEAVLYRQPKSIKYLCEHQNLMLQPMSLLKQAVAEANDEIVCVAAEYASLAELRQMKKFALERNQPRIARMLLQIASIR